MDRLRYGVVGVIHRVIDAKELISPSIAPIRFGKTGHVMLIDHRGIVMSCPILPTGVRISDAQLIPLVTPFYPGWVNAPSDGHGGQSTSIIGFAPVPETSRATNGALDKGSWNTFVWQSSDELFAPIRHFLTWMAVFSLVAVGLMTSLGYLAASRIVMPVRRLQAAAQLIGRGELRQPIDIQTGDPGPGRRIQSNESPIRSRLCRPDRPSGHQNATGGVLASIDGPDPGCSPNSDHHG
jgi:hypothetical protein